jgi:hypothetical protein
MEHLKEILSIFPHLPPPWLVAALLIARCPKILEALFTGLAKVILAKRGGSIEADSRLVVSS